MVSTDPISDMLTRIRNSIAVNKPDISLPHSKTKEEVASILVTNGFLKGIKVEKNGVGKVLTIVINGQNEPSAITEISRISRPGKREYVKAKKIILVKRGRGVSLISTSKGIMTGAEAAKAHLGGELICEVY